MAAVPQRIGKYQVSEVLGKGAMGVVYKAFDPSIDRVVAIKTVHKELLGDTHAVDSIAARFRNEAKAVGRIAHSGVVTIYEFGEDENNAFIVMEFVQGRNLDQILEGTPTLELSQLVNIMDQLLTALAAAHEQGVWHRDIKPGNLIITASGQVKLTDFGIARIQNAALTQVSSMIGTPGYMAPEQYMGEGIDHRSDLFACGVLLYRMLASKPPFAGSPEVVMYKVLNEQLPSPSKVSQRPPAYDAIVARAMAKHPEDRFASAHEMRQALLDIPSASVGAGRIGSDDDTVIVPQAYWAKMVEAASRQPAIDAGVPRGSSAAAKAGSWDPQELNRLERALASHVGPMAKLMVRQAASDCSDLRTLAVTLSGHIPEDAKRQQFVSAAVGGSQAKPMPSLAGQSSGSSAQTGTLSDDFKARALQVLTRQVGTIARVFAKRAADQSGGDKLRFIQLLVEGVDEGDRAALQRNLSALG